ncbi:MAG: thioredoxin [Omnitrophica bacterium]|nr:thioredoxin [Candidatus Omnitrophota bacterium]
MMDQKVMDIDSESYKKEILDSDTPVLVDFWAEWCMPCRMMTPVVDELSKDYEGKVKFAKINVDNNPKLATDLQILSIPVLILFKNGKELTRMTGVNSKQNVKRDIDIALKQ